MKRERRTYQPIIFAAAIAIIYIFNLVAFPSLVHGESLNSFDASIQVPDSQSDKNLSYFDVTLDPGKEEKLAITLVNKSEKTLSLKASFNRAVTNSGGVIEYSGINEDTSKSAPYDIEQLVTLSEENIQLESNQTKDVTLTVKMPEEKFSGVLAGGIYFEEVSDEKTEGNVKNVFSREIALLIHSDGQEVQPEVTITGAKADQANYRNVIEVGIENTAAAYVKKVNIDYTVLLDGKEVLTGKKEQLSIAPNTLFPFRIPFDGEEFDGGEYTVDIKVSNDQGEWEGSPQFTVTKEEAADMNEQDVTVQKSDFEIPWSTVALIAVLLALAVVVIITINKNRKLKKQLAKKHKKRKKRPRAQAVKTKAE
ncbi:DUF916 and DUF3324 domain-containing protein [Enterococcus sp. CWB-B31]|uniref:DUF916 and DUF3324 domain-containing protein n=1 Tax=Enterococcus sp. CWB-B31 TaxID=2885159 RepID=UPI001E3E3775|nr:DUF916 and DUF3324 domain-containing protein [Enterococcus sp. CWB-B31]MCB5953700.1 DUF916 and DUF3324 domain-containing protein [Enterococcus sp. CWB-B31]